MVGKDTYIELFGKRVEGWPATAGILVIWMLPFVAGYLLGWLFFRDGHFYPIEEESDEKVLKHVPLNPGTKRIETIEGRVIYTAPTVQ
jgi:hypothetical protein